ncbi:MAG: FxsA family protein [Devosia sp.]|nr:FxsA family protein [Devosia sp.]
MLRFVALGLIVLPIVEIAIFIKVGQTIGLLPTLALVIGAALLGMLLLRLQGLSVLMQLRSNVSAGHMPARTIADTMMIGLAAVFLVLPGLLSDAVALLLLVPGVRSWIYAALAKRVTTVASTRARAPNDPHGRPLKGPGTIDLDQDDYRPQ